LSPISLHSFPYPPLPEGHDAIRILTLESGNFFEPLVGKLTVTPFEDKPKYLALSYTWNEAYPDTETLPTSYIEYTNYDKPLEESQTLHNHAGSISSAHSQPPLGCHSTESLPKNEDSLLTGHSSDRHNLATMSLDDKLVFIQHILCLALLHLRSPTHRLALWVDILCIQQANREERSAQSCNDGFHL
jgi:Heterokaryon incompatibility protein (HET)